MIYIDYFSSVNIVNNLAKYTGGTNYVRNIIRLVSETKKEKLCILIPNEKSIIDDVSRLENDYTAIKVIDSLESVDYSEVRVLFLPQVNGSVLKQAYNIKRKNDNLKIYGTLHDKQHNCFKYDFYNRFYFEKLKDKLKDFVLFYLKKIYLNLNYSKWISGVDKIFTVSNFSLQNLINKNVKYINYYIQNDYTSLVSEKNDETCEKKNYILMVGAGRTEKNALRTLEAFCKFHLENSSSKVKLIMTGVSPDLIKLFIKSKKVSEDLLDKYVVNKGYVSYDELNRLYMSCKYVVFTSKAEGFGLPVLEAIKRNKLVLASYATSIPEVAGACMYYVNPYNVDSIKDGFKHLENDIDREKLEKYIEIKKDILEKQIKLDEKLLISELLSD